jgi:hypothetical protein
MEETLENNNEIQERPMFLKVLCILTFVGSGMGILAAIYGALTIETTIKTLEFSQGLMGGFNASFGIDYDALLEVTKKWGLTTQLLNLLGSALCLFGALMMWKLKKSGFYIYVLGQLLPLIASFGLMGGLSSSGLPGLSIIAAIFPVTFVILYAVNLKHLK